MKCLIGIFVLLTGLCSIPNIFAAEQADVNNGGADVSRQEILYIANTEDLAVIDPQQVDSKVVFLKNRSGGLFVWDAGDHTKHALNDRNQGIYITPSSELSGSNGAWVRQYDGPCFVEWFGAVGDGITNDSTAIQAALDYVGNMGGGVVQLLAATYVASVDLPAGVTLQGSGSSRYANNTKDSATVILRPATAEYVISMDKNASSLIDLDIDGSGGRLTDKDGIISKGGNYGLIDNVKVLDCRYGFGGNGGKPPGTFTITNSTFRQNMQGIRNFRDSLIQGCVISANYQRGIYTNGGQNRILGNFIDWNRDQEHLTHGIPHAAEGIYLDSKSTETIINNNTFDRNAGNDIFINNGAKRITIGTENHFKGSAWGGNLKKIQRYSIRVNGSADVIDLPGGLVETRNNRPSSIKGPYSPLGFADLGTSTGVSIGMPNQTDIGNPLNLSGKDLKWNSSDTGKNVYYLGLSDRATVSPIIQPDSISQAEILLRKGSARSLNEGEWGWGDNDRLGFNTVYVRLENGLSPDTQKIESIYNVPIINKYNVKNISDPSARDRVYISLPPSASTIISLNTRLTTTDRKVGKSASLKLVVLAESRVGAASEFAEFPFILNYSKERTTLIPGTVINHISEMSTPVGWVSKTISVSGLPSASGNAIDFIFTTGNVGEIDLEAYLAW